jgi:hypothetical protein
VPAVARQVEQALGMPSVDRAAAFWAAADEQAMQLAVWVPLVTGRVARASSGRLRGWDVTAAFSRGDLARAWVIGDAD